MARGPNWTRPRTQKIRLNVRFTPKASGWSRGSEVTQRASRRRRPISFGDLIGGGEQFLRNGGARDLRGANRNIEAPRRKQRVPRKMLHAVSESQPESSQPLDEPEASQGADPISRDVQRAASKNWRRTEKSGYRQKRESGGDEDQLAQFDADVECKQSEGTVVSRQSDFCQRAGESKAMQQTESECHDPRPLSWRNASRFAEASAAETGSCTAYLARIS